MTVRRSQTAGPVQDPKTGRWSFVVDIGVDEHGRRKQARRRGFKTKKDAQYALNELRTSVEKSTYVAPVKQTTSGYLDEWLEAIRGTLEPSTWSSYKRNLRLHVK